MIIPVERAHPIPYGKEACVRDVLDEYKSFPNPYGLWYTPCGDAKLSLEYERRRQECRLTPFWAVSGVTRVKAKSLIFLQSRWTLWSALRAETTPATLYGSGTLSLCYT
jgi:hypothetical protein